jgi:type IV secretory pathway TraG/TraD family ATPase VirD4
MDEATRASLNRPLGTAAWADRDAVENRYRYRDGMIWLGRSASGVPLGYDDDRHVCLVSGNRGGKGTTSIIPNLCLWPGSVVVFDPKGEDATVAAIRRGHGSDFCAGLGQRVHVLDPFGVASVDEAYRSRFNPLDALDPRSPLTIDRAGELASAIVIVHEDAKDPFWDESGRDMVKGLILHVLTAEQFEGRRNLTTLRQLLQRGDWEKVESLQRQGVDGIHPAQPLLWMSVARNKAFGNLLPGVGESFVDLFHNEPKVFEGVRQVALRNTEFIDSPGIAACTESSDLELAALKTDPKGVSLFLCLPPMFMSIHHRWLRMMVTLIVDEMQSVRGQPASGHRVLMILDEFAGLDRLKVVEKAVAQIAGYGVKLFFVLQTLEQLKATYKDNWETFLANSGLRLFFGIDDHFTRDHVSKLIGETEVIRLVASSGTSTSKSSSSSEGVSTSQGRSDARGTSRSESESSSTGTTSSFSGSTGKSASSSWSRGAFGGRVNEHFSAGENWSASHSYGTTQSFSTSHTEGTSETRTTSQTEGTSSSTTTGSTRGETTGQSETVHRRALIAPDEIGWMFARVDDTSMPTYPGLGLALTAGQRPIVFRRVNYFQDYQFIERFGPHPDHKFPQRYLTAFDKKTFHERTSSLLLAWKSVAGEGDVVAQGQEVARAQLSFYYERNWYRLKEVALRAPRPGRLVRRGEQDAEASRIAVLDLQVLHYNDGVAAQDQTWDVRNLIEGLRLQWDHDEAKRKAALAAEQEQQRAERTAAEARARIAAIRERVILYRRLRILGLRAATVVLGGVAFAGLAAAFYADSGVALIGAAAVGAGLAKLGDVAWDKARELSTQMIGLDLLNRVERVAPDLLPHLNQSDYYWR